MDTIALSIHESKVAELSATSEAAVKEAAQYKTRLLASDQTATELRAKITETEIALANLTNESQTHRLAKERAEAELRATREQNDALAKTIGDLKASLAVEQDKNLGVIVTKLVASAIDAGVRPALFEGYEANPAGWMKQRFTTVQEFEKHVNAMIGVAPSLSSSVLLNAGKPASGHDKDSTDPESKDEPTEAKLTDAEREVIERTGGGNTAFVGVSNAKEAKKRFEALQAAKQAQK